MIDKAVPTIVTRIRRFFASNTSAGEKRRSGAGLLLTLVLLPLLLGVLACLPVPVGDPEKSRIDPSLSGAWSFVNSDGGHMLMVLDPYDKRTWLLTLIGLTALPVGETDAAAVSPKLPFNAANADRFKVEGMGVYKCWLTKIGGETFMTWESRTLSEISPGENSGEWWVFRVRKSGDDIFYLDGFDYAIDGLDKVETRRDAEKIIRRHVDDPTFFSVEDSPRLQRLSAGDFKALAKLLKDFGIEDTL
ncbi:MAG: hypothetical protein WBS20_00580 [Lysobacterales bacterium]